MNIENNNYEQNDNTIVIDESNVIRTKKCIYCMSEIDEDASVCPNCRRKQPVTKNKSWFRIFIIIIIIAVLLLIIFQVSSVIMESNYSKNKWEKRTFERKAEFYLSSASTQFLMDDKDYMCYYIDDGVYSGSVKAEKDSNGETEYYIWLSDGKYYATGDLDDITVTESTKIAPTNCHRY